ncbi:MAG: bifunctional oligoribonuclease/PAP phosphatase NrnA [Ruminococcus sp.]|nr:bifunctional oligoribonuclease/PAP phosphatase NrnA [Candidatus Copronaster equi]
MITDILNTAAFLKENDNYLILTHSHPDGDTLGCGLALRAALRALGKNAVTLCCDSVQSKYNYMGVIDDCADNCDVIVAVDVADVKLLGKEFEEKYGDKIDLCIDHHASNRLYAKQTLLDSDAAAACEIVLQVIRELGVEITKQIAQCIYTGLTTDTGCFRYSNVTPRTMRMAADMIELGAENSKINTVMFETKTRTYVELERLAVNSMKMYFDGKCAFITITQQMYQLSGSDETEVDAIASIPRQIEGVLVGVTMREKEDGSFKISMRSNEPIDVSAICAMMDGGGHPRAAGCSVVGTLEEATKTVLSCIEKVLR